MRRMGMFEEKDGEYVVDAMYGVMGYEKWELD